MYGRTVFCVLAIAALASAELEKQCPVEGCDDVTGLLQTKTEVDTEKKSEWGFQLNMDKNGKPKAEIDDSEYLSLDSRGQERAGKRNSPAAVLARVATDMAKKSDRPRLFHKKEDKKRALIPQVPDSIKDPEWKKTIDSNGDPIKPLTEWERTTNPDNLPSKPDAVDPESPAGRRAAAASGWHNSEYNVDPVLTSAMAAHYFPDHKPMDKNNFRDANDKANYDDKWWTGTSSHMVDLKNKYFNKHSKNQQPISHREDDNMGKPLVSDFNPDVWSEAGDKHMARTYDLDGWRDVNEKGEPVDQELQPTEPPAPPLKHLPPCVIPSCKDDADQISKAIYDEFMADYHSFVHAGTKYEDWGHPPAGWNVAAEIAIAQSQGRFDGWQNQRSGVVAERARQAEHDKKYKEMLENSIKSAKPVRRFFPGKPIVDQYGTVQKPMTNFNRAKVAQEWTDLEKFGDSTWHTWEKIHYDGIKNAERQQLEKELPKKMEREAEIRRWQSRFEELAVQQGLGPLQIQGLIEEGYAGINDEGVNIFKWLVHDMEINRVNMKYKKRDAKYDYEMKELKKRKAAMELDLKKAEDPVFAFDQRQKEKAEKARVAAITKCGPGTICDDLKHYDHKHQISAGIFR